MKNIQKFNQARRVTLWFLRFGCPRERLLGIEKGRRIVCPL